MGGKRLRLVANTDHVAVATDGASRPPLLHAVGDPAPRSVGCSGLSDEGPDPDDAA
jgi:hypothetical protein